MTTITIEQFETILTEFIGTYQRSCRPNEEWTATARTPSCETQARPGHSDPFGDACAKAAVERAYMQMVAITRTQ